MFSFTLDALDGRARAGRLETPHGTIETPVFMPVGTAGAVKATKRDLEKLGAQIILANTYHHAAAGGRARGRAGRPPRFHGLDETLPDHSSGYRVFSLTGLRTLQGLPSAAISTAPRTF
jgi:queuine tRNA-ribosyltransferase